MFKHQTTPRKGRMAHIEKQPFTCIFTPTDNVESSGDPKCMHFFAMWEEGRQKQCKKRGKKSKLHTGWPQPRFETKLHNSDLDLLTTPLQRSFSNLSIDRNLNMVRKMFLLDAPASI